MVDCPTNRPRLGAASMANDRCHHVQSWGESCRWVWFFHKPWWSLQFLSQLMRQDMENTVTGAHNPAKEIILAVMLA